MNETNVAGFREKNISRHSERKKQKLVTSSSESTVNPVAELLNEIQRSVDEVPPVNTDVSQVSDVDPCDILKITTGVENHTTFTTIKFIQLKVKATVFVLPLMFILRIKITI